MPYADQATRNARDAEYRARNRELLRERSAAYRAANADKHREGSRRWYASNTEKARADARARYHADPDAARARQREWSERNPRRVAAHAAATASNQRAAKAKVPGRLTADDLERLWGLQPTCRRCGVECLGVDHVLAMANGGANEPANLQNLCLPCNRAKASDDLRPAACPAGHAYTDENSAYEGARRRCRTCRRQQARVSRDGRSVIGS